MFRDPAQRHRIEQLVEKWARSLFGADKLFVRRLHIWMWSNAERKPWPPFSFTDRDGVDGVVIATAEQLLAAVQDGHDAIDRWFDENGAKFFA